MSYSFGVSATGSPSSVTRLASWSSSIPPTEMTDGALTAAPSCRNLRSCYLTRASTSTGLKGFVM